MYFIKKKIQLNQPSLNVNKQSRVDYNKKKFNLYKYKFIPIKSYKNICMVSYVKYYF